MEKPFRFRHVNEIAGAFVLIAAILMVVGILISGQIQGWFQPTRVYRVVLPEAGTMGIKPGSEVKIMGSRAGSVDRVDLRDKQSGERVFDVAKIQPESVELVAVIRVRGERVAFVGQDSQAILRYDLGGFGAPFFEISRGTTPREKSDEELKIKLESDVKDGLTNSVEKIRIAMIPAIEEIQKTTAKIGDLATSLIDPTGDFQQALAAINKVTGRVNRNEGVAGVLLNDDDAAEQLRNTLANFSNASSDIGKSVSAMNALLSGLESGEGAAGALFTDDKLSDQIRKTVAEVEVASKEINQSLAAIPPMLNTTNSAVGEFTEAAKIMQAALREYEILGEALQRHWLVRKQVDKVEAEMGGGNGVVAAQNSPSSSNGRNGSTSSTSKSRNGLRFGKKR